MAQKARRNYLDPVAPNLFTFCIAYISDNFKRNFFREKSLNFFSQILLKCINKCCPLEGDTDNIKCCHLDGNPDNIKKCLFVPNLLTLFLHTYQIIQREKFSGKKILKNL